MNAERLHSVIDTIVQDNKKFNYVNLLQQLEAAYQQSVQSPNPQHAKNFDNAYNNIVNAVKNSKTRKLSPSRLKILNKIGGTLYIGDGLLEKIEEIFSASKTPSNVIQELQNLRNGVNQFISSVTAISNSFKRLKIKVEGIPKDKAELELLLPNNLTESSLGGLAEETTRLDRALGDLLETVNQTRVPLKLRSVSSGTVEFFIIIDPVSGAAILTFVTAVIQLMTAIKQARASRENLKEQGAPKKVLEELKEWEEKRIKDKINELKAELLKQYTGDTTRKNELDNALSHSLPFLADRIDRGLDIDVTIDAPLPPNEPDGDQNGKLSSDDPVRVIQRHMNIIKQLKREDTPILQLKWANDDKENTE